MNTALPRLVAAVSSAALALALAGPAGALGAGTDPELIGTLELPSGDVEYQIELGKLHIFDEERVPFVVSVIDGCSVNDHLWVFVAGLSGMPVPVTILDLKSDQKARLVLPAYEPGNPIGSLLEPEALRVCGDEPRGGLPALKGSARLTATDGSGAVDDDAIELRSDGDDDAYRRLVRGGVSYPIISTRSPIVAVDDSSSFDELVLLAEGRTPRQVEGVAFRGDQGMLPPAAALEKAAKRLDRSRVRRAFETAKNMRVPQGIIDDLGLRGVDQVHHVSLDLETLGADAYLAQAGWIRQQGGGLEPPLPVAERFSVETTGASGEPLSIPLVGPLVGSDEEGRQWEYRSDDVLVQVMDACALGGTFWMLAGAVTDEPLELTITDSVSGGSASYPLWTEGKDVSRLSDGASLAFCP